MGLFDSILGNVVGNSAGSTLSPILAQILGGQGGNQQGAAAPGLGGLVQRFMQAGHGDAVNSWVGNGQNQPIEPSALQHVFGQDQVNQWSQQTGMAPTDLLGHLAQFLPAAINSMTPNGHVPDHGPAAQGSTEQTAQNNPFDGPGVA